MQATRQNAGPPFDAFHGLRLDDEYDNTRGTKTPYPLGLVWSDVLYFNLCNRAEFEAAHSEKPRSEPIASPQTSANGGIADRRRPWWKFW